MGENETIILALSTAIATSVLVTLLFLLYARRHFGRRPQAYLYYSNGKRVLKHGVRRDVVRIGRHRDNDIHLTDRSVSRFHAQIVDNHNGTFLVRDLDSRNGCRIFHRHVTSSLIRDGDVLLVGKVPLKFVHYPSDYMATPDTVEVNTGGPTRMDKRRRRAERVHSTRPVRVYTEESGWITGIARNLSEEGMFIEAHRVLPTRTPLDIVMKRDKEGWLKIAGESVRSERNGMAVVFTDLAPHTRAALRELCMPEAQAPRPRQRPALRTVVDNTSSSAPKPG